MNGFSAAGGSHYWGMICLADVVTKDNSLVQRFDVTRDKGLSPGGELIMWSQWMMDSWGYGGYGPFHMRIWIILVIASWPVSCGAS
jgi:hypothetical protein